MAKTITRDELKVKRDHGERFHLVNVLTPETFARGHIPGSENIPVTEIEDSAYALWEPEEEIIVYCSGWDCHAGPQAAAILDRMGFRNVYHFQGGMEDWINGGGAIAYARPKAA